MRFSENEFITNGLTVYWKEEKKSLFNSETVN